MNNELRVEEDLVIRSRQGDKEAIRQLLVDNSVMIRAVIAKMTRNADLQKDIFQDIVIRIINSVGGFKGNCKLSTWLYRIAVNVALTTLSKENRSKKDLNLDDAGQHVLGQDQTIELGIERKELFAQAMSVVAKMSESSRDIFSLFYFADISIDEIAKQTGKSENAIKAVLFKGRKAITEHLEKKGFLEAYEMPHN